MRVLCTFTHQIGHQEMSSDPSGKNPSPKALRAANKVQVPSCLKGREIEQGGRILNHG
jgi:hypothetical protein